MATCQAGTGAVRRRQQNKRDRKIQKSNTKAAKRIRQRDNKKTPTHNQESSRARRLAGRAARREETSKLNEP